MKLKTHQNIILIGLILILLSYVIRFVFNFIEAKNEFIEYEYIKVIIFLLFVKSLGFVILFIPN